jgi:hypothetical protein
MDLSKVRGFRALARPGELSRRRQADGATRMTKEMGAQEQRPR